MCMTEAMRQSKSDKQNGPSGLEQGLLEDS